MISPPRTKKEEMVLILTALRHAMAEEEEMIAYHQSSAKACKKKIAQFKKAIALLEKNTQAESEGGMSP